MNTKILKIATLTAYITMVVTNYLAVALPLGGRDTGAISDSYPNLFAPAGYAFSIWGLIYALLGIYIIYQLWRNKDKVVVQVNQLFLANALLNTAWIFTWHYDIIWASLLIMIGLLVTLIRIADVFRANHLSKNNSQERWLVRLPFSVYFGWITVATIANVTVFLVSIGWNGFGLVDSFWTVLVLLVGAAIGSWRTLLDRSASYGLVLIWAYGAILYKHLAESGFSGEYPSIIITAAVCLLIFAVAITISTIKRRS